MLIFMHENIVSPRLLRHQNNFPLSDLDRLLSMYQWEKLDFMGPWLMSASNFTPDRLFFLIPPVSISPQVQFVLLVIKIPNTACPGLVCQAPGTVNCTLDQRIIKMGSHTFASHLLITSHLQTQNPVCHCTAGCTSLCFQKEKNWWLWIISTVPRNSPN